ncbi:MAG: hypothetical protein KDJ17_05155 [Hyphomicrobiaceae bacterium]|nr:hypothetical protein [Hyphomicrobiaceae bacterium]
MSKLLAITAAALIGTGLSATAWAEMPGADGTETQIVMTPNKGLPLDVGGKRIVSYFQQQDNACGLTVVLSESEGGGVAAGGSEGPHGTRITTNVIPGQSLRLDGDKNSAAEFLCGPEGRKMNAHIYTRNAYPGKSAGKS